MYAIQTDPNGRVVAFEIAGQIHDPALDHQLQSLPDGCDETNIWDYVWRDGEGLIYDPRPPEPPPEPDISSQLLALQKQNELLLECVMELSEILYA